MSKAIAGGIGLVIILGLFVGALVLVTYLPQGDPLQTGTLPIQMTAMDLLAGSRDADTTMVGIYMNVGGYLELQETVTLDAASKETANVYTSMDKLFLKIYDSSDTSLCTKFIETVVPYASFSNIYDNAFQMKLKTIDKGDTAKDILLQYSNNTAIAASATLDVTNESYDTSFATIDIEVRALDDDSGYHNTYNFLKQYDNNHYIVMSATGTGWDSVNMNNRAGWTCFDKASTRYFVYQLSEDDLTRDLKSTGEYDPDGKFVKELSFDLTGFESGDSVTFTYEYRWYASLTHFQDSSAWGSDSAATSETITIQY